MLTLNDLDWLQHEGDEFLHHATLNSTQERDMEWDARCCDVTLSCGITAEVVVIPGLFSRIDDTRCDKCCDVAGLPRGKGSPKNDAKCRPILGLD